MVGWQRVRLLPAPPSSHSMSWGVSGVDKASRPTRRKGPLTVVATALLLGGIVILVLWFAVSSPITATMRREQRTRGRLLDYADRIEAWLPLRGGVPPQSAAEVWAKDEPPVDEWESPLHYARNCDSGMWRYVLSSSGPNGHWDHGEVDDIVFVGPIESSATARCE
jgi:hypothetical protein